MTENKDKSYLLTALRCQACRGEGTRPDMEDITNCHGERLRGDITRIMKLHEDRRPK